ncbi:MAG: branched-chain amino acid ABC transporter permease [Alphaproteobacteria bacterium]|nr:branched-chain amino acid ABC transporter permease [Alphaproteobacteria bacterium]
MAGISRIAGREARQPREVMIVFVGMAVLLALAPWIGVYQYYVMQAMCYALLACAFNLLVGYGGLLSFGHAMFLSTAGYVTAHLVTVGALVVPVTLSRMVPLGFMWIRIPLPPLSPELAILGGTAAAAALSVATGYVAIRRQGIYFSMITLALAELVYFVFLRASFTHGEDGITGVPLGHLFGILPLSHPLVLYHVVLVGFLAGFLVIYRIINSPFGEVLKAIRDNEPRAISLGYTADRYKLAAFILSGTLAGFAGALKVFATQGASLSDAEWSMSGEIVLMTLLGGLGTVVGPVVGAFVIVAMKLYLADFGQWGMIVQGMIFVVCVLIFRRGIIGEIGHYFGKSL